jgi:signal transduction histidine kinase
VASIKADLARVQKASRDLDAKTLAKLDESLVLTDQVIKELRTLSYLLHPPLLDELGFIPALEWFVRGFIERSGIQVEVLVNGDIGRLTSDIEITLFRMAQECLSNIHRHSGSPSASICATRDNAGVVLQIADRGRGIAKRMPTSRNDVAPLPGVGIMGMGERLRQLGGQLEIESGDQGTTVIARVPTEAMLCAS